MKKFIYEHRRYVFIWALLATFTLIILVRYAMLASMGPVPAAVSSTEYLRGEILDREGRVLATEVSLYNIAVWRPELDRSKLPEEAALLAENLNESSGSQSEHALNIVSRIESAKSDFLYIAKRVQAPVARFIMDERNEGRMKGFVIEKTPGRIYPENNLACHLIGFTGDDGHGLIGIEKSFDVELSVSEKIKSEIQTSKGNSLVLAIDSNIQYMSEKIASRVFEENKAEAVFLLVSEVKTGEIIAYVNMPNFDPNQFLSYPESSYSDLPATFMFEPGSVFKVFTMASIMELGAINSKSTFLCDGAYYKTLPSSEQIVIKDMGVHGWVDIKRILMYSCNAGAGYASDLVSAKEFYDMLIKFGFSTRTGVSLPGESHGSMAQYENWSSRTKPTIAFGQEISVTSLQIVQAASAIGNSGVRMKPIVVKRILSPEGTIISEESPEGTRVISPETAKAVLAAMEAASQEGGSGWRANIPDVRIAVKTGTAQMVEAGGRGYSSRDFLASCLAILPANEPEYIIYVAVIKPRGNMIQGGQIAAPAVRETAEALINYYGLASDRAKTLKHSGVIPIPENKLVEIGTIMPDLRGIPKRRLIGLLLRKDINVLIEGDGWVSNQYPKPGEPVLPGSTITLILE